VKKRNKRKVLEAFNALFATLRGTRNHMQQHCQMIADLNDKVTEMAIRIEALEEATKVRKH
jgi:hypothetical protein